MDTPTNETEERGTADARSDGQDPRELSELIEDLSCANRRRRQDASHVIAQMAKSDPMALTGEIDALVDALYRPEAQTRWEVLDTLSELVGAGVEGLDKASDGAEASLFDEGTATVRLAAFRFLSCLGGTSPELSDEVWPLLDEAIQCYHGDPEYRDMLTSMLDFVRANISDATRDSLVDRITFDSTNGRGYIRTCSCDIIATAKGEVQA